MFFVTERKNTTKIVRNILNCKRLNKTAYWFKYIFAKFVGYKKNVTNIYIQKDALVAAVADAIMLLPMGMGISLSLSISNTKNKIFQVDFFLFFIFWAQFFYEFFKSAIEITIIKTLNSFFVLLFIYFLMKPSIFCCRDFTTLAKSLFSLFFCCCWFNKVEKLIQRQQKVEKIKKKEKKSSQKLRNKYIVYIKIKSCGKLLS